ncbi:MAG: heavy-metal-associated domain-containing protein [Geodermatophilaceae bacterium]|nr:heavy-metal-associated domain-containing protein [Geodermatophilaceae bacterium]
MITSSYTVTGMTCGHCVNAVTQVVSSLSGVRDVAVDLATGSVSVASDAPLPEAQIRAAVEDAGYVLAMQSDR